MKFDLKVGFSCNNDCLHCVVGEKRALVRNDLNLNQIKSIVEKNDIDKIVLTGGEITIRSDFFDILDFVKNKGIQEIILQTNGRMMADLAFAERASLYLSKAIIAVHSHNELIHDMITQRKYSWKQTVRGIQNLLKIGKVEIHSQTVISKLNCDSLLKTYDFINHFNNIKRMYCTFPHPNGNALKFFDKVVPKYSSFKKELLSVLEKHYKKISVEAIPLCYLHPYTKVNNADNFLLIDKKVSAGFDPSNKGKKFFNGEGITRNYEESMLSEKRKIKSCDNCIYNERCVGVWKEYYEHYKNEIDLNPILY
jgi:MoaA/NifB/PqqE/SkfB family radical SAM enzyme